MLTLLLWEIPKDNFQIQIMALASNHRKINWICLEMSLNHTLGQR